ncbi:monocyte to macrophage differentiation factor 2 [Halyomorpha halys]|uniref:monocyte to macrophage differentiation factor 2 n=1 Tax=Halyomorpha halys TaxID=286706 RepID=UPI0006D52458|nr:monocyte to macrophage differentiation factor 2 [Halyomorpha halys]
MMSAKHWTQLGLLKGNTYQALKSIKWMNDKPSHNQPYNPTPIEHIANVITHGIWVLPSIYGGLLLLFNSPTSSHFFCALIYSLSLIMCFTVSTLFHTVFFSNRNRFLRVILHRCDRAMIYIFIAGSYFPWVFLEPLPRNIWPYHLWWIVWVLALIGILYQQTFYEKYKSFETLMYVFVGLGPALVILQHKSLGPGEFMLKLGGALYILGITFFKCDGKIPCAHAIWHLFVAGAAVSHYFAILNHLYS